MRCAVHAPRSGWRHGFFPCEQALPWEEKAWCRADFIGYVIVAIGIVSNFFLCLGPKTVSVLWKRIDHRKSWGNLILTTRNPPSRARIKDGISPIRSHVNVCGAHRCMAIAQTMLPIKQPVIFAKSRIVSGGELRRRKSFEIYPGQRLFECVDRMLGGYRREQETE
jgi:hypothetical protein